MYALIVILHVLASIFLISIILLQKGKAGGLGGIFGGGGGTEQLFSTPSGSTFLRKATIAITVVFFLTTIGMTYLSYRKSIETVTGRFAPPPAPVTQPAPAQPQQAAPAPSK